MIDLHNGRLEARLADVDFAGDAAGMATGLVGNLTGIGLGQTWGDSFTLGDANVAASYACMTVE